MGDVLPLNNVTRCDIPPDRVLEGAIGKLEGVVIMGYDHDGNRCFASSYADGGKVLWLLRNCELALLGVE